MSRYDELVSIYLKAKDEYENDGRMCRDFARDLMKSIFRAFDCPSGIMIGDSRRNNEGFWENAFWLMIVPNFSSSIPTTTVVEHALLTQGFRGVSKAPFPRLFRPQNRDST
jgi:hypothetical protein